MAVPQGIFQMLFRAFLRFIVPSHANNQLMQYGAMDIDQKAET